MSLFSRELRLKAVLTLAAVLAVGLVLLARFVVAQSPVAAANREAPPRKARLRLSRSRPSTSPTSRWD